MWSIDVINEMISLEQYFNTLLQARSSSSRSETRLLKGYGLPWKVCLRTTSLGIETSISVPQGVVREDRSAEMYWAPALSGWMLTEKNRLLQLCYRRMLLGQATELIYTGY